MRLDWLEAFLQTAEMKSLTKASEALHMSQPALSKQIRSLEVELGAQLFMRSSVGVTLTPAGEILLGRSKRIVSEVNTMRREIALSQDGGKTKLSLGSWPSIATLYLPGRIADQREGGSRLGIQIRVFYSFYDLISGMENGIIDAALFDDRGVSHPFYSLPVFKEPFYLFVSSHHPVYGERSEVAFDEIKGETFVMLPEGCDVRMLVEKEFQAREEVLKVALEIELGQSILGFIQANLGITILPEIFVNQINDTVKAIPITDFRHTRQISVITREESASKPLLRLLQPSELKSGLAGQDN